MNALESCGVTNYQAFDIDPKNPRIKKQDYRSSTFRFVKKTDSYDLAFRTHGSGCGKILSQGDYNPRTTTFIKIDDSIAYDALSKANFDEFSTQVSYIPCLSPAEISLCVDKWINNQNK